MDNLKISAVLFLAVVSIASGFYMLRAPDSSGVTSARKTDEKINDNAGGLDIPDDYQNTVTIYWFWGATCPVCSRQESYIERWDNHEAVEIKRYEIENNSENRQLLKAVVQAHDLSRVAIPITFIGEKHWIGFSKRNIDKMEKAIVNCATSSRKCPVPTEKVSPLRLPN